MKNKEKTREQLLKDIDQLNNKIIELEKSDKKTKELIESIPIGISISTPEGDVQEVNDAMVKIFGYTSKEEFSNIPAEGHYYDPKDRERFVKLHKKGLVEDLEIQFKRKDGSTFWESVTSREIKTKTGKIEFINTFKDISKHRQSEEALQESNSLFTSIIESPDNIIMFALDTNYNYLSFNNAHAKEMKQIYDADIKVGRNVLSYIPHKADRLKAEINYKRVLKGERFIEIQEYGESGSRFWYELIFNPIVAKSHHVTGFTVFVTNITDRKLAELQLEAAIKELKKHKGKLEETVKERTRELEERNKELDETLKVFVGRELKIKELQTKIRALEGK